MLNYFQLFHKKVFFKIRMPEGPLYKLKRQQPLLETYSNFYLVGNFLRVLETTKYSGHVCLVIHVKCIQNIVRVSLHMLGFFFFA